MDFCYQPQSFSEGPQITTCKLQPPTIGRLSGSPLCFFCSICFLRSPVFAAILKRAKGVASFSYLVSVFISLSQPLPTFPGCMLILLPQFPPIINLRVPLAPSLCLRLEWWADRREGEGRCESGPICPDTWRCSGGREVSNSTGGGRGEDRVMGQIEFCGDGQREDEER